MSIYLVDYENYKNLAGISVLSENDRVVIFYSIKANTLSFESHKDILNSKARIEYKLVEVGGQNALDFQLSSYLGSLIGVDVDSKNKYYIVSKDKGFGYVATFWKNERNLDIEIIRDLSGKPQEGCSTKNPSKDNEIHNDLKQSSLKLTDSDIIGIVKIVNNYKTPNAINSNINKLLKDSAKAGEVFKLIKPYIKK